MTNPSFEQFLEKENISLSPKELLKYQQWANEKQRTCGSFLGWIYVKFKTILQESSIYSGIAKSFSPVGTWEENAVFPAFHDEYQSFDRLANFYGNLYRGSFLFNYTMGAIAVLLALIPVGFDFEHLYGEHAAHLIALSATAGELIVILMIWFTYKAGSTPHGHSRGSSKLFEQRWHERWLEYRLLAERFRYMEVMYPIGLDPLVSGAAADHKGEWGWTDAYFKYRLTMPRKAESIDMDAYNGVLSSIVKGQAEYHKKNEHRMEHIHHHLHNWASMLFFGTLIACLAHFVVHLQLLTLLAGFLPALAASFHGILANGEFAKNAEVSSQMSQKLLDLAERLKLNDESERVQVVKDLHNIVINDALGWKAIFKDKNVPLA